jgi:phosphinothricin acetyltransferase
MQIRDVRPDDAWAVHAIYAHHVLHGTASFDLEPPPLDATSAKIVRIAAAGWPFLVADVGAEIAGYAYVTQFRDRAAYRFAAENSIYVHPDFMGRGIGMALLLALLDHAAAFGFRTVIAVVGGGEPASVALHKACGFREAGRLEAVGWKHGRWLDSVYLQLELAPPV